MHRYKAQLCGCLQQNGWEVMEISAGVDWWADEHWKVRSVRNRWGYKLTISFLVNPHCEGRVIWAIAATEAMPSARPIGRDGETIAWLDMMKGRFDEKLSIFVATLNNHRDQPKKGQREVNRT